MRGNRRSFTNPESSDGLPDLFFGRMFGIVSIEFSRCWCGFTNPVRLQFNETVMDCPSSWWQGRSGRGGWRSDANALSHYFLLPRELSGHGIREAGAFQYERLDASRNSWVNSSVRNDRLPLPRLMTMFLRQTLLPTVAYVDNE